MQSGESLFKPDTAGAFAQEQWVKLPVAAGAEASLKAKEITCFQEICPHMYVLTHINPVKLNIKLV